MTLFRNNRKTYNPDVSCLNLVPTTPFQNVSNHSTKRLTDAQHPFQETTEKKRVLGLKSMFGAIVLVAKNDQLPIRLVRRWDLKATALLFRGGQLSLASVPFSAELYNSSSRYIFLLFLNRTPLKRECQGPLLECHSAPRMLYLRVS